MLRDICTTLVTVKLPCYPFREFMQLKLMCDHESFPQEVGDRNAAIQRVLLQLQNK